MQVLVFVSIVQQKIQFFEITGYFNAGNWLPLSDTSNDVNISIDGVANSSTFTGGTPSLNSPSRKICQFTIGSSINI